LGFLGGGLGFFLGTASNEIEEKLNKKGTRAYTNLTLSKEAVDNVGFGDTDNKGEFLQEETKEGWREERKS